MQQQTSFRPAGDDLRDILSGQSLTALLALVGTKKMSVEDLRRRTRLSPPAFVNLLGWLQAEYLVDMVSTLEGTHIDERVELTERGEALLLGMLERTCELPELH